MKILSDHADTRASSPLAPTVAEVIPATKADGLLNLWQIVVMRSDLTAGTKLVLLALHYFADWTTGAGARPGAAMLAAASGQSVRNVRKALEAGEAAGYIVAAKRGGGRKHATVYRLTVPVAEVPPALIAVGRLDPEEEAGNSVQPDTLSEEIAGRNSVQPDTLSEETVSSRTGNSVQPDTPSPTTPQFSSGYVNGSTSLAETSPTTDPPTIESTITPDPAPAAGADRADDPATDTDTRPADRCPNHIGQGWVAPCRRCKTARDKAEAWDAARKERLSEALALRMQCPDCDDSGYLLDPDGRSADVVVKCAHTSLLESVA